MSGLIHESEIVIPVSTLGWLGKVGADVTLTSSVTFLVRSVTPVGGIVLVALMVSVDGSVNGVLAIEMSSPSVPVGIPSVVTTMLAAVVPALVVSFVIAVTGCADDDVTPVNSLTTSVSFTASLVTIVDNFVLAVTSVAVFVSSVEVDFSVLIALYVVDSGGCVGTVVDGAIFPVDTTCSVVCTGFSVDGRTVEAATDCVEMPSGVLSLTKYTGEGGKR